MRDNPNSAFHEVGMQAAVHSLMDEVREVYRADRIPWVVGYSGGKDSTATLQLVWTAIAELPDAERTKPIHVISTDTLVENPIVATWVTRSLAVMGRAAEVQGLPIQAHRLTPDVSQTYWVNLLGRGYPSPSSKFRWCTERMKIKPSNTFINNVVRDNGEAIVVLGTRKAESSKRHNRMKKLEKERIRDRLSPNKSLPNSLVFSPIEDWTNDDVWLYLMQIKNPWGFNNKELLTMYSGASEDGECPLVVDTTTPSCGDSRFGCWVCTLVDEDKSMSAMIKNDFEKEWMLPLLEFRNELLAKRDKSLRDFRRLSGAVQLFYDKPIPGPYKQSTRESWLQRLLEVERAIRETGPEEVRGIELITLDELREIRRIWVVEKHELEDSLPGIFEKARGEPFPDGRIDDSPIMNAEAIAALREVCGDDEIHFGMMRECLSVEARYRTHARRAGLYDALEDAIRKGFYKDENDATARALRLQDALKDAEQVPHDMARDLVSMDDGASLEQKDLGF